MSKVCLIYFTFVLLGMFSTLVLNCESVLLPCTDNVLPADMLLARNIIESSVPPNYRLADLQPRVTTGRNPHRWVGYFTRNDNQYRSDCLFLVSTKKDFKRYCPQGSEIRAISVNGNPNNQNIEVEFLVNCYCTKITRRRRRSNYYNTTPCHTSGYTKEETTCSGT